MKIFNLYKDNNLSGKDVNTLLRGKTVFITGATGRIGCEVAKELALFGARLILHYNSHVRKACELELSLKLLRSDVTILQADYTEPSDVKDLIRNVNAQTEHIDYLVHAAGVCRYSTTSYPMTAQEKSKIYQINQVAPIEITLGLNAKIKPEGVIFYTGSCIEAPYLKKTMVDEESKKRLHNFVVSDADHACECGVVRISFAPCIISDRTKLLGWDKKGVGEIPGFDKQDLFEPVRVARNIVFFLVNSLMVYP